LIILLTSLADVGVKQCVIRPPFHSDIEISHEVTCQKLIKVNLPQLFFIMLFMVQKIFRQVGYTERVAEDSEGQKGYYVLKIIE
jgi:hypothetical protein